MINCIHRIEAILLVVTSSISLCSSAKIYKLEGEIGGVYSIILELEEHDDGLFSGRYAYKSTLQKEGEGECSWLLINPSYENPASQWSVRDCKLNPVETWYNIRFANGRLTARMKNTRGKVYEIVANVTDSGQESPSMTAYFKDHLGECASDFGLLSDPSIQQRLEAMMGQGNFNNLTHIYQTQGPIEYHSGMYWASGFVAHQCCDPATLWAYDSYDNTFYVWIRKDSSEYWWSEAGSIPYKFHELVNEKF